MSWVSALARPEIVALEPYQHAAWDPDLTRLHANELPWRLAGDQSQAGLNRYPEPQPRILLRHLAGLYDVAEEQLLATRGSDEAIDLLVRAFCRPGADAVLICPPTFAMYAVSAQIQGAALVKVPLQAARGFALDEPAVLAAANARVKIVFLCSPNNPTGNPLDPEAVLRVAAQLAGRSLVVLDEAYVEFSGCAGFAQHVRQYPNLCVLRTLSKAHGLAGARCGALIADPEIAGLLKKVIPPYAITQLTLEAVLRLIEPAARAALRDRTGAIRAERERVARELARLPTVTRVWPSAANFLLADFTDAADALARARRARLLVRDARGYSELPRALRITIGEPTHNNRLIEALA